MAMGYRNSDGTTCLTFLLYYGAHRRVMKNEVFDGDGTLIAYELYDYVHHTPTRKGGDERFIETYLPDGTLLFSISPDGIMHDANGELIDDCRKRQFQSHLPKAWFVGQDECKELPNNSMQTDDQQTGRR